MDTNAENTETAWTRYLDKCSEEGRRRAELERQRQWLKQERYKLVQAQADLSRHSVNALIAGGAVFTLFLTVLSLFFYWKGQG